MQFADRLNNVETSAIRELFKLLGKPGIISFAGGFPDSAMFDVQGIREASERALRDEPGAALRAGNLPAQLGKQRVGVHIAPATQREFTRMTGKMAFRLGGAAGIHERGIGAWIFRSQRLDQLFANRGVARFGDIDTAVGGEVFLFLKFHPFPWRVA